MSDVFTAVADPTRRTILERLRVKGALSISALTDGLPISRQAVTKHLDQLESARLIRRSVRGRERMHELRSLPLRDLDDWLAPYSAAWDGRLERLQRHLEGEQDE